MLVVMSVGMTGVALPVPRSALRLPPSTERFPCESCPCGCSTAEYCWDKCCCHSDEEKLRWAVRNSVRAPQFLIDRVAARSSTDQRSKDSPAVACCCCVSKPAPKDTVPKDTVAGPTPEPHNDASITPTRYVQLESVAKCRGIRMMWTLLAQLVIPPPREIVSPMPRLLYRFVVIDERAASVLSWQDPPVPWLV